MRNLKLRLVFLFLSVLSGLTGSAQNRREINIPDILGYKTLKCDFHIHTVFSDGDVWPTVRVQEAWCDGLDVISITDHIEYRPHGKDLPDDFNSGYERAKAQAEELNILLVPGAEITKMLSKTVSYI